MRKGSASAGRCCCGRRTGGLDIVVANAGTAAQLRILGDDPTVFRAHDRGQPAGRLDMTQPGFGTKAAEKLKTAAGGFTRVAPLEVGVNAIERGITRRSRRVVGPGWVGGVLPVRMLAQRLVDRGSRRDWTPRSRSLGTRTPR